MRRGLITAVCGMAALCAPPAAAQNHTMQGPIEYVRNVPFDWVSGIGSEQLGDLLYLTGTRALSIYDVSTPDDPQLVSHVPYGYEFQNEDVSTNGRTLLISEQLPGSFLHVWDVSNPALPIRTWSVPLAGDHTATCVMDCTFAYGSEGSLVDLREGGTPQVVGDWLEKVGKPGVNVHDVEEVRPGLAVACTNEEPFFLMDVSDPMNPKLIAEGDHPAPDEWLFHSARWPQEGRDPFLLLAGEAGSGPVMTWKVGGTEAKPTFKLIDSFTLGSTSHWFDEHPRFAGGGLVVVGWYSEGARLLEVSPQGKFTELGYFQGNTGLGVPPMASNTWAVYWISDDVFYSIDNQRGIDVLRYTGPIPAPSAPGAKPQSPPPPPPPPSSGSSGFDRDGQRRANAQAAKLAKRARLRGKRTVRVALQAYGAGTARVRLYARGRLVGSGTRRYDAAGPGSVVVRVGAAARRARKLKLRARVDFTPDGGATVTSTR